MQKIAIHGREVSEEVGREIATILAKLKTYGCEIFVSESFASTRYHHLFKGIKTFGKVENSQFDCFLSVGGDGTFLETLTYVGPTEIPILGINTGRLGFLASISRDHIDFALDQLMHGNFVTDKRALVSLQVERPLFSENFALNKLTSTHFQILKERGDRLC